MSPPGAGAEVTIADHCPTCGEPLLDLPQDSNPDPQNTGLYAPGAGRGDAAERDNWPIVPGYQVLDVLGSGGMGVVYKARQVGLKRVVALKMILTGSHARAAEIARFRAEAEAAARLQHPGIVHVYEIGEWRSEAGGAPMPFFSLEYVDGGSLATYLASNPQPPRFAAELMMPLTDAVQYAHDHNVVHRDLKPGNVLLHEFGARNPESGVRVAKSGARSQGSVLTKTSASALLTPSGGVLTPKITDFGLAKQLDEVSGQTMSGAILGTPSYMAPEQAQGHVAGPAVDVYALGAILYEMLTGRPPFKGANVLETLEQVRKQEPVAPTRLQPKTPRDLETICLKCLRKESAKRYASAGELGDDLRRFLKGEPILARHIGQAERFRLWCKRNPLVAFLIFFAIATLILGAIGSLGFAYKFWGERVVARENEAKAIQKQHESERRRYVAEFRGAVYKWDKGDIAEVLNTLDGLSPKEGEEDLRGFEWYYLKRQCELELRTLAGHSDSVFAVAYSPDGLFLASASRDKTIHICDRASGEIVRVLRGHPDEVFSIAYSADGKRLATGGSDGTIKVWDVLAGLEEMTLTGHSTWVRSLVFAPDGKDLFSSGSDGTVRRWNLSSRSGTTILTNRDSMRAMAYCPTPGGGGMIVAGSSDGVLRIHDLTKVVRTLPAHAGYIYSIAVSPDGSRLASAGQDRTIKIWDTSNWQLHATLTGHTNYVNGVAFSADGRRLVSGSDDRTVRVWDINSSRELLTLRGHVDAVYGVAFSPDGRHVASAGDAVKVWDARESLERLVLAGHSAPVHGVAFSPNGRLIASCGPDQSVIIWDATTGLKRHALNEHRAELECVAFHPTRSLLASGGGDGGVQFWDTDAWRPIEHMKEHQDRVRCVAFSPDGRWLATASDDATIALWDVDSRRVARRLRNHTGVITAFAFSSDSRELASVGRDDQTIRLWDVESGRCLLALAESSETYSGIAFDPAGRRVAAGALNLWDLTTGQKEPRTHPGRPRYGIVFSPDGRRIASTGTDGLVRVYDTSTGLELLTLVASDTRPGHRLAFSPDGARLVCCAADNFVYLWDARQLRGEERTEREAVSLIHARLGNVKDFGELANEILSDRTTTEAVRGRALQLIAP